MGNPIEDEMATGVDTCQTWTAHLGEHDDLWSMAGHVHRGSEQQGSTQANSTCAFGAPVHVELAMMEQLTAVPRFCGGATLGRHHGTCS